MAEDITEWFQVMHYDEASESYYQTISLRYSNQNRKEAIGSFIKENMISAQIEGRKLLMRYSALPHF